MFTNFKIKFSILLAFMLVLVGCDNKIDKKEAVETVTIEHAQGRTPVPLVPQKVVVLNMATLDIMDALDIPVTSVPKSNVHFPDFLKKYDSDHYDNAGTLFEPNYEAISTLNPDLIIAGGRANDAYGKLLQIAPTLSLEINTNDFLTSLTERTYQLGLIFNKGQQATQLMDEFVKQIDTIKPKASKAGTALVVMVNGGKMSAYGSGSRFGFVFDQLGFKPATTFEQSGMHGNAVSSEFISSVNPDWIFVLDRDSAIGRNQAESAKQVLDNPLIKQTTAAKNNHIVYLDSSSIYLAGGIQTYSQLMNQINTLLDSVKDADSVTETLSEPETAPEVDQEYDDETEPDSEASKTEIENVPALVDENNAAAANKDK